MHEQGIIDDILSRLHKEENVAERSYQVRKVSLVCTEEELKARICRDIEKGIRDSSVIERSLAYLPLYEALDTVKTDVTGKTPEEKDKTRSTLPFLQVLPRFTELM